MEEECVGREGLYKSSQQLWVTNTRDGYRTGAANQLKTEQFLRLLLPALWLAALKVWHWKTDSTCKNYIYKRNLKEAFLIHPNFQNVHTCNGDEPLECFGRSPNVLGYGGIPPDGGLVQDPRLRQGPLRPAMEEAVQLWRYRWGSGWGRTAHSGGRQSTAQLLAVTWESAQMHASTSVNLGACRPVWTSPWTWMDWETEIQCWGEII